MDLIDIEKLKSHLLNLEQTASQFRANCEEKQLILDGPDDLKIKRDAQRDLFHLNACLRQLDFAIQGIKSSFM